MNRLVAAVAAILLAAVAMAPPAEARVRVSVGFGLGCCWATPWWGWPGYPGYPGYYVPPVVVYAPPPPVAYYPPPTVYFAPQRGMVDAVPASPVYVDSFGRTCREYQTTAIIGATTRPVVGTACQQPDGSWRVVR